MLARHIAVIAALCLYATSANALSMKECSDKYKAAQTAGTLNGQKWNDFRKAECGAETTPAAAKKTEPPPEAKKTEPTPSTTTTTDTKKVDTKKADTPAPVPTGNIVFPDAVSPKYAKETAGKARRDTCLDQYNANKANNANGGLTWIEKGGGYYSLCNKHLKGA